MSFDTEFDYTNILTELNAKITAYNATIANYDTQITDATAVPVSYEPERTARIDSLNSSRTIEVTKRDSVQNVVDEIAVVQAYIAGNKTTLYDFYVAAGEPKPSYMQRMLFNMGLIADAASMLADGSLDTTEKQDAAAIMVCEKYPIATDTARQSNIFYRNS